MFKNTFQSGFLSILYSIGSKPLQIWEKKVRLSWPDRTLKRPRFVAEIFTNYCTDSTLMFNVIFAVFLGS
jgi:hypothetical protein